MMTGDGKAAMTAQTPATIEVLIIDDNPCVCRFLSRLFTGMGYSVSHELTLTRGLSHIFQDRWTSCFWI